MQTVEEYLLYLKWKGFHFHEDAIGFIYFGKHYTNASDKLVNIAIELTLKAQKRFDGSFYVSLLELFAENKIHNRQAAILFAQNKGLLQVQSKVRNN
ncbi:hypothetical protein G4D64_03065 [Bacillus sp. 3H-10]|uniref:Uncharacterized protein n=1 Tax=Bacillus aquiflavi TaxID=2672567 RepID=A0A6B3VY78_9BACI|nr:hypothetical protein [Bacillus aquiflavi]